MNFDQIRDTLGSATSENLQHAMLAVKSMGNNNAGDLVNLGCNTALCSLVTVLPILSSIPIKSEDDVIKAMNHETLLFAALIVVRMHGGIGVHNKNARSLTGQPGVELAQEVNFGPSVMTEALRDWKTLTNKNPADFFNANLLKALSVAEQESLAPFDEFMKKRINGPSSSTLN